MLKKCICVDGMKRVEVLVKSYLGVLTSRCRMKRSLLPLLSMSPFQARAPTLEETELRFHILGLDGHNRRDESQRGKMLTLTVHCDQTAH